MMISSSALSAGLAGFLASFVECVEALTVVLAVGAARGWSGALGGAALALAVLFALILVVGRALIALPLGLIQLVIGALLLVFGLRWLRKAVGRAAGVMPLRDENAAYAATQAQMRGSDRAAIAATLQVTLIEGVEVVFIVISLAASGHDLLAPSAASAAAALLAVIILGAALHRPMSRVPENTMKFAAATLLCAFGVFSIGEGVGLAWPGGDISLFALTAAFLAASLVAVRLQHRAAPASGGTPAQTRPE